jgi:hypothetical protein
VSAILAVGTWFFNLLACLQRLRQTCSIVQKKLIAYKPRLNIHRAIRFTPARPFLCSYETIVSIPSSTSAQQVLLHHTCCLENCPTSSKSERELTLAVYPEPWVHHRKTPAISCERPRRVLSPTILPTSAGLSLLIIPQQDLAGSTDDILFLARISINRQVSNSARASHRRVLALLL